MKNIIHFIVSLFVTVLLGTGATAAFAADPSGNSVQLTKYIALDRGDTLWSLWKSLPSPRPAWEGYWKDACTLSRIPCDDTWSKLPVGTVITVFRSDAEIAIEMKSILLLRDSERNFAIEKAKQEVSDAKVALRSLRLQVEELRTQLFDALVSLGIVIVVLVVAVLSLRSRRSKEERRKEESDCVSPRPEVSVTTTPREKRDAGDGTPDDGNFIMLTVPRDVIVEHSPATLRDKEVFPVPTGHRVIVQAPSTVPQEFDPDFPQPTSNTAPARSAEQFPVPTGQKNTHGEVRPEEKVRTEQYPSPTIQKKSEDK